MSVRRSATCNATTACVPARTQGGVCAQRAYMTEFLASMAGLPAAVCDGARLLSAAIDFDPVDKVSDGARDLETYHQICEQLMYLRTSSTLD
eukprot:687335-Prymnesium_polylepis.1